MSAAQQQLLDDLHTSVAAFEVLGEQVVRTRQASQGSVAARILGEEVVPRADELLTVLEAIEATNDAALRADTQRLSRIGWGSVAVMLVLLLLLGVAAVLLSRRGALSITRPLSSLVTATGQLARGETVSSLTVERADEIGQLTASFNAMVAQRTAARGELEQVNARLELQAALQAARLELAEALRGRPDLPTTGRRVLDFIMPRVGALVGAVHALDAEGVPHRVAHSGTDDDTTAAGGLVVRAVDSAEPVLIDDLPTDYVIGSGVGEAAPRWLRLQPLRRGDRCVGVLELAGFAPPSEEALSVLEGATEGMAYELDAAGIRARVEALLRRTTEQKEKLAVQQEELRVSNEELGQQAEELRASEEELQVQAEELRQLNEELATRSREVERQNRQLHDARAGLEETARQLQETSRFKSEFLANMSHELRTPLNSVLLLSRLLAENKSGALTGKEVEYATAIGTAGSQLLTLINDVLDLSKVEAGRVEVQVQSTDLEVFLETFRSEFVHLAAEKGLDLRIAFESGAPTRLDTDPGKLRQILVNLVGNAIKFTDSGSVAVAVEPALLDAAPAARLCVRDTGAPIPQKARTAIFHAFQQVDGSSTRAHGGTGLGLTISRELAGAMGGKLVLEPDDGAGNEFTLTLPLTVERSKGEPEAPREWRPPSLTMPARRDFNVLDEEPPQQAEAGRIVLIVEDDEIFSTVVAERSRREGLEPILATTGEDALRLAAYHRPVGIVLDIGLPDMDGWAVLGRLKQNPVTANIPVHVITGRDDAKRAREEGVGFQQKPLTLDQLGDVVQGIAAGPTARATVLVVDDDDVHARGVAALLENEGISVDIAGTSRQALELLETRRYGCAIVDLGLPDQSGAELIRVATEAPNIELPKTVLYTGRDLSRAEAETLRTQVDTIVLKDERSPERLLQEVSLFLGTVRGPTLAPVVRGEAEDDVMVGRKVLIVDDDMRNVFALMASLEAEGLEIEVARNGQEAIDRVTGGDAVDLVLMDIMMPVMNGYDAMAALRADPRFARLPIIALTAKATSADKARCLKAGASDYLPKPVDLDRLLSMMRVWLYDRR